MLDVPLWCPYLLFVHFLSRYNNKIQSWKFAYQSPTKIWISCEAVPIITLNLTLNHNKDIYHTELLTASHHICLGSIPNQSTWGLWWTEGHWDSSPSTMVFSCHYHSKNAPFNCHQQYIILAVDRTVTWQKFLYHRDAHIHEVFNYETSGSHSNVNGDSCLLVCDALYTGM